MKCIDEILIFMNIGIPFRIWGKLLIVYILVLFPERIFLQIERKRLFIDRLVVIFQKYVYMCRFP